MSVTLALFLPLLVASLAGVIAIGMLRTTAERVRAAADLAVLVAANDQDDRELARTGGLVLARDATAVARAMFAANLEPLTPFLGSDPAAIADAAEVTVDRRLVSLRATVPVRTVVVGLPVAPVTAPVSVRTAAAAR